MRSAFRETMRHEQRRAWRREWVLCALAALLLASFMIRHLEGKYLPAMQSLLSAQISNQVTRHFSENLTSELSGEVSYSDLVTLERDEAGQITAITTNIAKMNLLKEQVVSETGKYIEGLDASEFSIPVGSLTKRAISSGRGLKVPVKAIAAGTVTAEFQQSFSEAGINQTRHQILLEVTVPVEMLLAGETWTETVKTQILVAETVIVGQVPQTYLQFSN